MVVEHRKVADTAVKVLKIISDNNCNVLEATEIARTVTAVVNSLKVPNHSIEKLVHEELSRRYNDNDMTLTTEIF